VAGRSRRCRHDVHFSTEEAFIWTGRQDNSDRHRGAGYGPASVSSTEDYS